MPLPAAPNPNVRATRASLGEHSRPGGYPPDMNDDSRQQRQSVWTRHWATGAPHSCAGTYAETYGGSIGSFWSKVHEDTPSGARVLDIATGSGALPRLLLQLRPDLPLQLDAVDLAVGEPAWVRARQPERAGRVRFHGAVSAESLPFADDSFDLVISQYGLEYADPSRSVSELLRVLAPGGSVAMVLHHAEARPVTLAAVEITHIDWLRGADGLLTAARDMLAPMALAATPAGRAQLDREPRAHEARERFNRAQDELARRSTPADGADILGEVQDNVAQLLSLAMRQGVEASLRAWLQVDEALARTLRSIVLKEVSNERGELRQYSALSVVMS